jgi:hypothetical protein
MLTLDTIGDYALMVVIAAVAGMAGGLAAELLLSRDGQTGAFELPRRKTGMLDLGGFASLLVGAVAGVAILLVLPASMTVVTTAADGTTTSTPTFDLLRLIATTLVAGSAGSSVLTALQARVTSAINAARVEFVRATGEDEVDRVRDMAVRQLDAVSRAMAAAKPAAPPGARSRGLGAPSAAERSVAEDAIASAAREIEAVASRGRRAVATAAQVTTRTEEEKR